MCMCVYVHIPMYECRCICAMACMWRSEDNLGFCFCPLLCFQHCVPQASSLRTFREAPDSPHLSTGALG